jgi:hypothetical protein
MYNTINKKINILEHKQTSTPVHHNNLYLRVINKNKTVFIAQKLTWMNKGPKCNLSIKRIDWIKAFSLETEKLITILPTHEQDYIGYEVAKNVKQLYKQYNRTKHHNNNYIKNKNIAFFNSTKDKLNL